MIALKNLYGLLDQCGGERLADKNSLRGMADDQCAVVYYQGKLNAEGSCSCLRANIASGSGQCDNHARVPRRLDSRACAGRNLTVWSKERAIDIDGDQFDFSRRFLHASFPISGL